jgi:phosphoglycolate phosphatase
MVMAITAILFDLDGTLLDTAADLALALNNLLAIHNQPTLPVDEIKPFISQGSTAMIEYCFGINSHDPRFENLRQQFLQQYRNNFTCHTVPFPGVEELIDELHRQTIPWGVVTNKTENLAKPLLAEFSFADTCRCIIGCDTLPQAKPHPAPLLYACQFVHSQPAECIYVGDARRDIEAGLAAGMKTVVANYGYIPVDDPPTHWGAEHIVQHPNELLAMVTKKH